MVLCNVTCAYAACQQEDGRVLENVEVGIEEGCSDETCKAGESLMNGNDSNVYQMVTNADGTVSLVGLDTTQLDQLLHIQGNKDCLLLFLLLFLPLLEGIVIRHVCLLVMATGCT